MQVELILLSRYGILYQYDFSSPIDIHRALRDDSDLPRGRARGPTRHGKERAKTDRIYEQVTPATRTTNDRISDGEEPSNIYEYSYDIINTRIQMKKRRTMIVTHVTPINHNNPNACSPTHDIDTCTCLVTHPARLQELLLSTIHYDAAM